jgi:rod shape-determining protein MreD
MRVLFSFALALLLVSFETAVLHHVGGGYVPLALALPIVVYLGLHAGNVEGAVAAAGVGYVLDLMAGGPKGLLTSLAVALFLFSRVTVAALSIHGRLGFALLSGTGTFLYGAAVLLVTGAVAPAADSAPGLQLFGRVLLEATATGFAAPLVFILLRRVEGLFSREDPGLLL